MPAQSTDGSIPAIHQRHRGLRRGINAGVTILVFVPVLLSLMDGLQQRGLGLIGWVNLALPGLLLWTLVQRSYWRCPNCQRFLSEGDPNFCSRCGARLRFSPAELK